MPKKSKTKTKKVYNFNYYSEPHMDEQVKKLICKWLKCNPSDVKNMKDKAKLMAKNNTDIYKFYNTTPDKHLITYTSGTLDSNTKIINMITNSYKYNVGKKPHIVISKSEHAKTLLYVKTLENADHISVTYIEPDITGIITAKSVQDALTENTCLVSIIYTDYIIGAYNNIPKIAHVVRKYVTPEKFKIPFHTNMGYLFNKYKLSFNSNKNTNIDALSADFKYLGGPKGVGLLIIKRELIEGFNIDDSLLTPNNFNSGMIAGAIESLKISMMNIANKNYHQLELKEYLIDTLKKQHNVLYNEKLLDVKKDTVIILGSVNYDEKILPNILTLAIPNKDSKKIQDAFLKKNILIESINDSIYTNYNSIQISFSDKCTKADINILCNAMKTLL